MAHEFDKIFKESQDQIMDAVVRRVLQIPNFENSVPLRPKMQKTLEREADMLCRVRDKYTQAESILHGEVQSSDEAVMLDRKLFYFAFCGNCIICLFANL